MKIVIKGLLTLFPYIIPVINISNKILFQEFIRKVIRIKFDSKNLFGMLFE